MSVSLRFSAREAWSNPSRSTSALDCCRGISTTAFTIFHNPKCSKSQAAVAVFEEGDAPYVVHEYLKRSPLEEDLKRIARVVEGGAGTMLRDNSWPRVINPDEIAFVISSNPILMERPLVVAPDGSAVCRPITASATELKEWISQQQYELRAAPADAPTEPVVAAWDEEETEDAWDEEDCEPSLRDVAFQLLDSLELLSEVRPGLCVAVLALYLARDRIACFLVVACWSVAPVAARGRRASDSAAAGRVA
jgi:arsenate reductase